MADKVNYSPETLGHTWSQNWWRSWWRNLDGSHHLAGGTQAACASGEVLLGVAPWGENPEAAANVLPVVYAALVTSWRKTVKAYLREPAPPEAAEREGERVADLFTDEERAELLLSEPVATYEEHQEVVRHYRQYLKSYQERNPTRATETGKDNVVAYVLPEDLKPGADSYMHYLRRRAVVFKKALEDSDKPHGLTVHLPIKELREHALVVARSGGGKTEVLKILVHQIIQTGAAVLVIDPHGEFSEGVAKFDDFADAWRDRLVYIDPTDQQARPCLNPFSGLANQQMRDEAGELADALLKTLESDGVAIDNTLHMELMLTNCIRVLLQTKSPDLRGLYRFMNDAENGELVALGKKSNNEMLASYFANDFVAKERSITKTAVRGRLQKMLDGDRLHLFCGQATVNVEKSLDAGKVVVLNLAGLDKSTGAAVGRFMLARLFSLAKRRGADRASSRRPVFIAADEAHLYLGSSAGSILAETRKFGVHLIAAQQSVEQSKDPAIKGLLMSQTAVKLIGVTNQDAPTRAAFAKVLTMPASRLKQLQRRQFALAVDGKPPVVFWPRSDLAEGRAMTAEQWEGVLQEQRAQFYRTPAQQATPDEDTGEPIENSDPSALFPAP